jgi:hypothetical protein
MKSILPGLSAWICALVAAVAIADDAHPPTTDIPAGDQLLMQVIAQLERRDSVVAHLRHQVSLDGRQLAGTGGYWQQGSGEDLRVRLELQLTGAQEISLLQVSNGRFLWSDVKLPTGRSITRLDLRQLRSDSQQAATELAAIQPGQATWSPVRPELTAFAGGLPTLLASFADSFTFMSPQAMRLKLDPPLVNASVSLPVFATIGHWKPARLAEITAKAAGSKPGGAGKSHRADKLPTRVPQEVLLIVGQADLFPYRIEYRPLVTQSSSSAGDAAPYQLSTAPLLQMEFSDVSFNTPIAASQFDYSPGDTQWNDRTTEQLQKLRRQRQEGVAAGTSTATIAVPTQRR